MPAPEIVIVADDGTEHVFPPGFDPKKAAAIVRQRPQPDFRMEVKASEGVADAPPTQTLGRVAQTFAESILPSTTPSDYWQGPAYALRHPIESAKLLGGAILGAHDQAGAKMADRWQAVGQGDLLAIPEALGRTAAFTLPVIGPAAGAMADRFAEGDIAGGVGGTGGLLAPTAAPRVAQGTRTLTANIGQRMRARNPNQAEALAVQFGLDRGVPIDAATATGNPAIRGTQNLADRSLLGAGVATRSRQQQADALGRVGNELADEVRPGGSVTPEQAGEGVRTAVLDRVRQHGSEADAAYGQLRSIEQQNPGIRVGLIEVKTQLRPLYNRLKRESELVPLQGDKGRALTALDRLMNGPDSGFLSDVDAALGDLKALARADIPELRTQGQGIAAQAVQQLEAKVQQTAGRMGRGALNALMEGRRATVSKYGAADVLDQLRTEPVQVFNQTVWAKDAGIDRLREIATIAPNELPKIGRAYLEDLVGKATAQGGFSGADGLFTKWQNLGPQTKQLLFQNPRLVRDLDSFFLLAKKINENPNPSGSAYVASLAAQGGYLALDPVTGGAMAITGYTLAKLLHNPTTVRLLTQGLRTRANTRTGRSVATQLARAVKAVQGGSVAAGRTNVAQQSPRQVAEQPAGEQEPERQYAR